MVVGDGMMAKAFAAFAQEPGVVIFASGVSDSTEISAAAFEREEALLRRCATDIFAHAGPLA